MKIDKSVLHQLAFHSMVFLFLGLLLGCKSNSIFTSPSTYTPSSTTNLTFDPAANNIVVFADFRNFAEPPREHEVCQFDSIPLLRIWGDGLTFLDLGYTPDDIPNRWEGCLDPNQLQDLLHYLEENAFFSTQITFTNKWAPPTPYLPKRWYQLGVNLRSHSVVYESPTVDLFWNDFSVLLRSFLSPLEISEEIDPRIRNLNIGSRLCTTPTPEKDH
jgi:hypothetical protein